MTPLPQNPKVIVLVDANGTAVKTATNVAPDLEVVVTNDPVKFAVDVANQPFVK